MDERDLHVPHVPFHSLPAAHLEDLGDLSHVFVT